MLEIKAEKSIFKIHHYLLHFYLQMAFFPAYF